MSAHAGQKVVVITGASGGLGRALTDTFLATQWQVIAVSRTAVEARPNVHSLSIDVTIAEQTERAFGEVLGRFGRLDALINNAGVTRDALFAQMSDDDWDKVLDVNLRAAFCCSKWAAPSRSMIERT